MKLYNIIRLLSAVTFSGLLLASCSATSPEPAGPGDPSNPSNPDNPGETPSVVVSVRASSYDNGGTLLEGEQTLTDAKGYLFVEGKMVSMYDPAESEMGELTFTLDRNEGTFYVLSNTGTAVDWSDQLAAQTAEKDFLASTMGLREGLPIPFFSGSTVLNGEERVELPLKRGVSRFDLNIRSIGTTSVESLTLEGATLSTRCFPDSTATVWMEEGSLTFTPATPYTEDTRGVAYVYEQPTAGAVLKARVVTDGKSYDLETQLPETILRNHIYIVTVLQGMVESDLQLTVEAWEQGGETGVIPDFTGAITINTEASDIPVTANISADKKAVTLPAQETELLLALDCNDELEAQPVSGYPVTIEPVAPTKALPGVNLFRVRKPLYAPGVPADEVALRFRRKGLNDVFEEDKIVLHLSANPVTIEGEIHFDREQYGYDFGRYVENELGRMTLPAGKSLVAEALDGEDLWIQVTPDVNDPQVFRILGGWKPNDPTADGRTQTARLVICNTDGSEREEYTVSRRNWGLPVVEFGGKWWCKYNLRGNAQSIEDQVSIQEDLAISGNLADYLKSCPEETLLELMGDNYQGGNVNGLPLKHNGTAFYFEGMKSSGQNFSTLDPTSMAPVGYAVPSKEDLSAFGGSENYNLGGITQTHPYTTNGQNVSVRVVERDAVMFHGNGYGNISFYEFTANGNKVVLFGLGHQWNTDAGSMATKNFIVATNGGNSAKSWMMEGYANTTKANQNWWKYMDQNTTKTRVIRCIKTPVEYIY